MINSDDEELQAIDDLIDNLNNNQWGMNMLKDDPMLNTIKLSLIALKNQLTNTIENNLFNIMRDMFLNTSIDIFNKCPMAILGTIKVNNYETLPINTEFISNYNIDNPIIWRLNNDYHFYNINIETNYINHRGIIITLSSDQLITAEILNNMIIYGKGNSFFSWLNDWIHNPLNLIINDIVVTHGKLRWNKPNLWQFFNKNFMNNPLNNLLNMYWTPEIMNFFSWQWDNFLPNKQIIIEIPWCNKENVNLRFFHNYFIGYNYFFREALPIIIDENNLYVLRSMNIDDTIQKINGLKLDNKYINAKDNNQWIYGDKIQKNQLMVNFSNYGKLLYENKKIIGDGWFSNRTEPLDNQLIYLNNNGNITHLTINKVIHKQYNYHNEYNQWFVQIINEFLNFNYKNWQKNTVENFWNSVKNLVKLFGFINNKWLLDTHLQTIDFYIKPEILLLANRYQVVNCQVWVLNINNYHGPLIEYILNEIFQTWDSSLKIIIQN